MITATLTSLFAFILAIGILVTIHEFGHFWVARKSGVKVLRFSVGFGKPLWKYVAKDQTEYVIAAIPLGGYVKMLDEREGHVPDEQVHQAFNRQNVWKRIAIVAAGPIANFILAIIISTIVFLIGMPSERPYLAAPDADTPAAKANVPEGAMILAINELDVSSWSKARLRFLDAYLQTPERVELKLQTEEGGIEFINLDLREYKLLKEVGDPLGMVGLMPYRPKMDVIIAETLPESAAEKAGLQANDLVLQVNGQAVMNANDFVKQIKNHANKPMTLLIQRSNAADDPDAVTKDMEVVVNIGERSVDGQMVGSLGAKIASPYTKEMREKFIFLDQQPFFSAIANGVQQTWQFSILTLKAIGKMLVGEASLKNISGPVTIADLAGKTLAADFIFYLSFLAMISVSLGVLNLLPIPMLDGGHLLYYIIELFTGKPVSENVEAIGFRIGLALVASMMMLALYNDITRLIN